MREEIPYFRSYYEPPDPPVYPRCPKCGSDDYCIVYLGEDGWCGCDNCIISKSADDYWEEQFEIGQEENESSRYGY